MGGTERCRHRGDPSRAPQGRAGHAKAEGGENGSSQGKRDNSKGHTASSSPTTPLDMVLPPWLVLVCPQTPPREDRRATLCPLTPRAPQ